MSSMVLSASAGFCCYDGCGKAPSSCNSDGEYCSSASTCGSCGGEWCGDSPTPSPTPPSPPTPSPTPPSPTPTPLPGDLTLYCPSPADLFDEYGSTTFADGGWKIIGDGRVSTKTTFNTLGGYVEFDMDTSNAHCEVNTNIYTISPDGGQDFCGKDCYGDIQDNGSPVCMELDIIENNGNCKFASTWHTKGGFAGGGCDAGGCAHNGNLPGGEFHMKSTWGEDGMWLTYLNDEPLYTNNYLSVTDEDKRVVKQTMMEKGVIVISSQWTGWVPGDGCCGGGDLDSSEFTISNLRVLGKVMHGPEPTKCSDLEQIAV